MPQFAELCPACGKRSQSGSSTGLIIALIIAGLGVFGLPIIAIIAAIAIPNFLHARAEAQTAADEANEKQIAAAVERYHLDRDRYPRSLRDLVPTYLASVPAVPGATHSSSYSFHQPSVIARSAAYDIWDDGARDTTTTTYLRDAKTGLRCTDCRYVIYVDGLGITGRR